MQVDVTKKILVAYFSYSGNTREIADQIHKSVGGDIFEIQAVKPYPDDYDAVVKQARQELNLTQEQLGEMVGVQKAQISKIENSVKNARLETILKVFNALGAKVNFNVELNNQKLAYQ